jgi:hypothetical protein
MKVSMRVPVACFYRDAFVTRLQQDVLPASSCNGVNVTCSGRLIKVTASCKPVAAPHFRSIISKATRGRLLSGADHERGAKDIIQSASFKLGELCRTTKNEHDCFNVVGNTMAKAEIRISKAMKRF